MPIMEEVYMARPCKFRFVEHSPYFRTYKPVGVSYSSLEEIYLTFDEMEALRLADFEELYQEEAATKMNISRQTFGNIIASARKKVADFLLNGKALRIEGGRIMAEERIFVCSDCGYEWKIPFGEKQPEECPKCGSASIERVAVQPPQEFGRMGMGQGRGMGQGIGYGRGMGRCIRRGGGGMGRRRGR